MNKNLQIRPAGKGVALALHVITRAHQTEITQVMEDGSLKVRLNAPPLDGKANQALIEFFTDIFKVHRSNITIVAGEHSRNKVIAITGIEPDQAEQIIFTYIKKIA
ncbi:MAG: DUF167 domain-containing protein [Anaerolineales bacterium]